MRIILVGHPGSQKIVPASKYLTSRYLPDFQVTYLNYAGDINGWSKYVRECLERAADKYVIFALDDYLVSGYIDMSEYLRAEKWMSVQDLACIKLCYATIEENLEYPVTTQYSLWNRECLMALLKRVLTPWEFEVKGRELIKEQKKQCGHVACIPYFANSSLSSRWTGVRLDGLKQEDIQTLISNGYI